MDKILYEKKLLNKIVNSILLHGGKKYLLSIIITGSFGRHEPTYIESSSDGIILKSDIEIALVYKYSKYKNKLNRLIVNVCSEFKEELNLMLITEKRVKKQYNFNFSMISPKYKSIFTFDLFEGSYTIWGVDLLNTNTNIEIDEYEAKRLVANRIGELIYNTSSSKDDFIRCQWKSKIVLALGSAYLICKNKYVSSYKEQYELIEKNSENLSILLGNNFVEEYTRNFKFIRENEAIYETKDDDLRGFVFNINKYFNEQKICKSKINSASRFFKYFIKCMKAKYLLVFWNFENQILTSLINEYYKNEKELYKTAEIWHKVLY